MISVPSGVPYGILTRNAKPARAFWASSFTSDRSLDEFGFKKITPFPILSISFMSMILRKEETIRQNTINFRDYREEDKHENNA